MMTGDKDASRPRQRLAGLDPVGLMTGGMSAVNANANVNAEVLVVGFEVVGELGAGGMGVVYLGRQVSLDREVAVKVLTAELASDPLFLERLEREARVMGKLRHPNIVTVHDFQRLEKGGAAIVMEFVEGGSLRERLRECPEGLPVDEALRIVREVASGLVAAHAAGVIHRDMKPENVLLQPDGTARLTDFGLALPLHESTARLTLTGTTVGTLDYMAPEQFREGQELDVRLDIYALGVVAYEVLTGLTPRGHFDSPHRLRPEVSRAVSEAVMRALRPRKEDRFLTVAAFLQALDHDPPRRKRVPLTRWGWGAVAVLLMSGLGWYAKSKWDARIAAEVGKALPAPSQELPPEFGPWRDGIAGTRIYEDVIAGDWTHQNGVLTSNEQVCLVRLEDELPDVYDVKVTFTRLTGEHSVAVFFQTAQGTGSAELDAWKEGLAGVQVIDGESLQRGYGFRFSLEKGRRYELLLEVRREEVRMSVDGVFQKAFDLRGRRLTVTEPWEWDPALRPAALALGSYQSSTRFEKVEWRSPLSRGSATMKVD